MGNTKFETIGVQHQLESQTKVDANASFKSSCRICVQHGLAIECDRCAIAVAHDNTIAAIDLQQQINCSHPISAKQNLE